MAGENTLSKITYILLLFAVLFGCQCLKLIFIFQEEEIDQENKKRRI